MLQCISCGFELPEVFNSIACPKCSNDELHNWLYSTSLKNFEYKATPLTKYDKNTWLKREDSSLLSGTFKDRKTAFIQQYYYHKPTDKYALASSGNMAISFSNAYFAYCFKHYFRDNAYLWVSPAISLKKLQILKNFYPEIRFTDKILSTKELTLGEADRWNITNGMDPIGASAYYSLGLELEPCNFDNIIVPCGSGELYSALAVYFGILRKQYKVNVIPITSKLPEADAIKTDFVACQPFLNSFGECKNSHVINDAEKLKYYSDTYNCEYSSAVVFAAYEQLKPAGRTCLIITGAKR